MSDFDFTGKFIKKSIIALSSLLLLVVVGLFLYANRCGLGLTYDSHIYLKIAEQIGSDGFFSADGLRIKPPIYPLAIHWVGEESLTVLNLACLLVSTGVLFYLGLNLKSTSLKVLYFIFIAFVTPHYLTHAFAWTEPLFITGLLLAFLFYYLHETRSTGWLLYISLFLFLLLPFVRFSGILIVVPIFAFIFINAAKSVRNAIIAIGALGVVIIGFWVLKNADGFLDRWNTLLMPFHSGSPDMYLHNLDAYLEGFSLFFLPLSIYKPLRMVLAALVLLVIILQALQQLSKGNTNIWTVGILSTFNFYYVTLHPIFHVEYYTAERYLTPLFGLLVFSGVMSLDNKWKSLNRSLQIVAVCLLFWLGAYNTVRTLKNVIFWHDTRCEIVDKKGGSN
ncbi:MAG: hypothetical protein JXQ96_01205 [Cyclobacteriaceae bacterium]